MSSHDFFTAEVIRHALASTAEEMSSIVQRCARSPLLRESGDHSSAITAAAATAILRQRTRSSRPRAPSRERSLVTTLNAALLPTLAGFQKSLEQLLPKALRIDLFHSAGGMLGIEMAARQPVALAMSGPAAGVEAASYVATELDEPADKERHKGHCEDADQQKLEKNPSANEQRDEEDGAPVVGEECSW
jgi:hypothetical protein